ESGESQRILGLPRAWGTRLGGAAEVSSLVRGDAALRAAGKLLPAINKSGARQVEVDDAVNIIGDFADPGKLFEQYAERPAMATRRRVRAAAGSGHVLANMPAEVRLALEMATHEESERRALEGELALLETAWREAEEIAA